MYVNRINLVFWSQAFAKAWGLRVNLIDFCEMVLQPQCCVGNEFDVFLLQEISPCIQENPLEFLRNSCQLLFSWTLSQEFRT